VWNWRKQWPSGMTKLGVDVSGRIDDGPSVGQTIGRLTDLGWGARLRKVLAEPGGPAPDDVLRAAVAVLAGWQWQTRPVAVMGVDSGPLVARSPRQTPHTVLRR
jgi:ATP-dependent DNA helicase RecQ